MRLDSSLSLEIPERKEKLFLPTFPLKSALLSRNKKKRPLNSGFSKTKLILSAEEVKVLCERIESKTATFMPPLNNQKIKKKPIKMKTFRFNKLSAPTSHIHGPVPIKPVYFTKLFDRKTKEHLSEPYKLMLTGANFSYLNSRILENDSSTHSIQEIPTLESKYYKHFSPEPKQSDVSKNYFKTSTSFMTKDYKSRRIVFKAINLKK